MKSLLSSLFDCHELRRSCDIFEYSIFLRSIFFSINDINFSSDKHFSEYKFSKKKYTPFSILSMNESGSSNSISFNVMSDSTFIKYIIFTVFVLIILCFNNLLIKI